MRRAFFILGPESSGTRMLTHAFNRCGVFGDEGHIQRLDAGFRQAENEVVFRRSVPHADDENPPISEIIADLRSEGFQVIPVAVLRDKDACAASQVRNRHAPDELAARRSIESAISHIFREIANSGLYPIAVQYEPFTGSVAVREVFFRSFGFDVPQMTFFNGNERYDRVRACD
jgi:hypothetical protein